MKAAEISTGTTLAGRYRIDRLAFSIAAGDVWAGHDAVLDRPVLAFPLPFEHTSDAAAFAARYATIQHPGLVAIYDAAPGWLVCESPAGGRLAEKSTLQPGEAARAMRDVARALRALHDHGVAHGSIGPDAVFFDEEGRGKLAIHSGGEDERADLEAFGALIRAVFGSTKKRAVPPEISTLLARGAPLREIEAALVQLVPAPTAPKAPGFFRQEARWLVPVIMLVVLAIVAVLVGLRIDVGGKGFPIKISKEPSSAKPFAIATVRDFDPEGDHTEHPQQAPKAADGDNLTQWFTVGYASASFGGAKHGVGLVFDLGEPRDVGRIVVTTTLPGWTAEWRSASGEGPSAGDFPVVQSFTESSNSVTVTLRAASPARYWLLWLTSLVRNETGPQSQFPYQASVAEVSFFER